LQLANRRKEIRRQIEPDHYQKLGPAHGYAIVEELRQLSGGAFDLICFCAGRDTEASQMIDCRSEAVLGYKY
jgi:hypothetical protein